MARAARVVTKVSWGIGGVFGFAPNFSALPTGHTALRVRLERRSKTLCSPHFAFLFHGTRFFSRRPVRAQHPAAHGHGLQPREGRERAPADKRQRRVGHNVPAPGASVKPRASYLL